MANAHKEAQGNILYEIFCYQFDTIGMIFRIYDFENFDFENI